MSSLNKVFSQAAGQNETNRIVQGLWIGSTLSIMEKLSIVSFLENGHEYHLYAYDELPGVPRGATVKDANKILPASLIFQYRDRPSYSAFSNFFRYRLLLERGGWWVDSDTVCLRHFDFPEEYVVSSQKNGAGQIPNVGAIKAPRGSEAIAYAWSVCQTKKRNELVWGEIGPALMAEVVERYRLQRYVKPYYVFCPIEWERLLVPYVVGVPEEAYAIHLWNSMWVFGNQDKNATYNPGCIYEQLKTRYL